MEKDRVVIDSTVWLHGIHKRKHQKFVEIAAVAGVVVYTCRELTDEVGRNLHKNPYFKKHITNADEQIAFFNELVLSVEIDKRFDRAADLKDNYLFDLAYSVKSHFIVTSETKLLNMKRVNRINIISPTSYFAMFGIVW